MVVLEKIIRQANVLSDYFPKEICCYSINEKLANQELVKGATDWYAVPNWKLLGQTYFQALENVLDKIDGLTKGSYCPYHGHLSVDLESYKLVEETKESLNYLGIQQSGKDILVFPCQLGERRANQTCLDLNQMAPWEFPLDPFSVACILLTHQDMIKIQNEFASVIMCPGAESFIYLDDHDRWKKVLGFVFWQEKIEMVEVFEDVPYENGGPATGYFNSRIIY